MAKTLAQFASDIRAQIAKGKLKAARKLLDKAQKAGHKGPQIKEVVLDLDLAEGGGEAAAQTLREIADRLASKLPGAIKSAEAHLRKNKDDHLLRDAVWEMALVAEEPDLAIKHLGVLMGAGGIDPNLRAQSMVARKDATGATGVFLLASLGGVKTDRLKLADRLLNNEPGARILTGIAERLYAEGNEEKEIHYVLAKVAKRRGDRDEFLMHAGKAFDEDPEGMWTNTMADQAIADQLEFALSRDSLRFLLEAAADAPAEEIIAVAQRAKTEGTSGGTLRGLAVLLQDKPPNACRLLEQVVQEDAAAAAPLAEFLAIKTAEWSGAHEVYAAVVAAGAPERAGDAADNLLLVQERGEAWGRVAPRILEHASDRDDLRRELGLYLLQQGEQDEVATLLQAEGHLPIAKTWAESGLVKGPVLLRAATLAEEHGLVPQHADWLLKAGKSDGDLLAQLSARLSGTAVSADTAIESALTLLEEGQKAEAAQILSRLALDEETGQQLEGLLREKQLLDDREFQTVSFRAALALGDSPRAKRLFKGVPDNVQALAEEAAAHPGAARVLADVLIGQDKGEISAVVLDKRHDAGDDARTLLPLTDALLKASPRLSMGRLLRAKLLRTVGRDADAIRDLRAIPSDAAQVDEAFKLLGELAKGDAGEEAKLGRADIHIGRKMYAEAIKELSECKAPANERLQRFEGISRQQPERSKGHQGQALCLLELGRIPEAAEAHLRRFTCRDADPAAVATDIEAVARAALAAEDIQTASSVLEALPDQVSDGAERAIKVIADDQRAPMLILRSKLLLQQQRTEEAVTTLSDLVIADPNSRAQAAKALEAIVESGQARPDADLALAGAYQAMENTPQALNALSRLYADDITSKDKVVQAAETLIVKVDDPEVRIFLGNVCIDKRDPNGATEHAIHARRLRPEARRECVTLLQRALDLDAFAPDTHFALGEAHLAGDETDDAVRHFRAAVEVDKNRAKACIETMEEAAPRSKRPALLWLAIGTTYAEFLRDHNNAVKAFTHGLNASPPTEMMVPLLLGRGDSFAALRKDNDAFNDFDKASEYDLLERRYYEFLRSRHRQKVLEAAEEAKARAGEDFASAAEACGRYIKLGHPEEAVKVAQEALATAPTDLGPRYLVGVALHAAGRYDAAAQVLEMVRDGAGPDTDLGRAARVLLAESYLDNGDRVRARACLTEIEAVNSAYPGLKARRAALAPPADDPLAPPPLFVRPRFPRPTE
ncbi:MAG: tetratricopeptide repeat protein [Planctomycetota bacterium]|jgi:tetratricopeptide (TPR) repeat protein